MKKLLTLSMLLMLSLSTVACSTDEGAPESEEGMTGENMEMMDEAEGMEDLSTEVDVGIRIDEEE